jgi:hypothetical protein
MRNKIYSPGGLLDGKSSLLETGGRVSLVTSFFETPVLFDLLSDFAPLPFFDSFVFDFFDFFELFELVDALSNEKSSEIMISNISSKSCTISTSRNPACECFFDFFEFDEAEVDSRSGPSFFELFFIIRCRTLPRLVSSLSNEDPSPKLMSL